MLSWVLDPALLQRRAVQLALLGGCSLASACGPSFEVLAEGDLRFVHCDRLDLDPKIAPSHRLHCWREWRRMYTYGQTRDRVEYAQRRIAEVVSGDTNPPFQLPNGEVTSPRHSVRPRLDAVGVPPAAAAAGAPAAAAAAASVTAAASVSAATAASPATPASPEELACRGRCEEANAACAPGCETRPTGCKRCERPLEACLGDCKNNPQ
jgi:hypothetical protein